jgi:signal peptidase I
MNPETQNPSQIPLQKENFLKEIVKFIILALVIIVPIRTWVADPFIVSGASMDNTFANGQYLIVDQLSYHFEQPARGDVIIFRYPKDPSLYFIKRIIGLPGETVSINNGIVTIYNAQYPASSTKGLTLSEPYISPDHRSYDTSTITLGPTQYFVMGDNRNESSDSRIWGPVDRSLIIGRPIVRLLPPSVFSVFPGRDTVLGK